MGIFSKFERKMEDTVEGTADKMVGAPLSPVQIAKKAEKQMRREKMVGAGKQYAPTLYTVLVNADDDERLFGYYPTLAGETETYLSAKAAEHGLVMDGQPLVRFIVDEDLRHGKFEIIAEMVAAPLVSQLRQEEMERYGIATPRSGRANAAGAFAPAGRGGYAPRAQQAEPSYRDPYTPQDEYDAYDARDAYDVAGYDGFGANAAGAAIEAGTAAAGAEFAGAGMAGAAVAGGGAAGVAQAAGQASAQPHTMVFGQMAAPEPFNPAESQLTAYLYDVTNDVAFTLTGERMSIGRESGNQISIPDINASRRHAEIRQEANGSWILSDLGSTNGTFVNGRRIKSAPLHDADMIVIGTTNLEFQLI